MIETNITAPEYDVDGVRWALSSLRVDTSSYDIALRYYEGQHRLNFATEKFRNAFGRLFAELSINQCPMCVDVPADRLQIEGFTVVSDEESEETDKAIGAQIAEIWRRNRMNKRAGEVHSEALKTGDAYVIVDFQDEQASIYPNGAGRCAVKYDEENPGYIIQAAKWWPEVVEGNGKKRFKIRLNVYYQDRIEKFETSARTNSDLPDKFADFKPIEGDWLIPNPYNKVPVFHFANNADMGRPGKSELKDIIPVQDAFNKTVCDMLVSMEYAAIRQRYVTGLQIEEDDNGNPIPPFKGGLSTLWVAPPQVDDNGHPIPASEAQPITFGEFSAADLAQFIEVKNAFRQDIASISGIPMHYFMDGGGGWPSGESLKTAEQRLTAKVSDRQIAFGNVWEDVMRFCLEVEGNSEVQVSALWKDTGPRSVKEDIENVSAKVESLKMPTSQAFRELGYKEPEIEKMKEESDGEALAALRKSQTAIVPTVGRNLSGSRQTA